MIYKSKDNGRRVDAHSLTWMTWDVVSDLIEGLGYRGVFVDEESGLISDSDTGIMGIALGRAVVAREGDMVYKYVGASMGVGFATPEQFEREFVSE